MVNSSYVRSMLDGTSSIASDQRLGLDLHLVDNSELILTVSEDTTILANGDSVQTHVRLGRWNYRISTVNSSYPRSKPDGTSSIASDTLLGFALHFAGNSELISTVSEDTTLLANADSSRQLTTHAPRSS
jgi:hypothetical protein